MFGILKSTPFIVILHVVGRPNGEDVRKFKIYSSSDISLELPINLCSNVPENTLSWDFMYSNEFLPFQVSNFFIY